MAEDAATARRRCGSQRPIRHQTRRDGVRRIRSGSENLVATTAHNIAHQFATAAGATHDLLDRRAGPGQGANDAAGLLPPQVALVLQAFGMGQQRRVDDMLPSATRTGRIDRRTASKSAALAFFIRCQRSAIARRCGAALVAA